MDEKLRYRLEILKQSGQIDNEIINSIEKFINTVEKEFQIKITEENGSMFVTHMAMAIPRIQKGEEIVPLGDSMLKELETTSSYDKIPNLIKELENNLGLVIPEAEFGYIGLHLANLIYNKN